MELKYAFYIDASKNTCGGWVFNNGKSNCDDHHCLKAVYSDKTLYSLAIKFCVSEASKMNIEDGPLSGRPVSVVDNSTKRKWINWFKMTVASGNNALPPR